ncbi:MAG: FumA C-terminus/TtdB family hydratase beta subunit [Clostridiales bacterium]|jgi:fumarate hydratase subunit beta|nr:FumA C-terminus/TtdB family hydratase beta subunit [Clostridiales bacterium]
MSAGKIITAAFSDETIRELKAGDSVFINGTIYTGRDAAHKRMFEACLNNEKPPFEFSGSAIYYAGPSPAPPGRVIGSIGPTTSSRMDKYSPLLISRSLKVMIGKGKRGPEVIEAIKKYGGLYLSATGGAAALLSRCVKAAKIIAYEDLGTEAVRELQVFMFPAIVAIDANGNVFPSFC